MAFEAQVGEDKFFTSDYKQKNRSMYIFTKKQELGKCLHFHLPLIALLLYCLFIFSVVWTSCSIRTQLFYF